ncbi:hypothetical protein PM02_19375 [Sulfitobacter mediterraneus]|uniref:Uncharacterized protein n=1 Tax=Sulfitobacter mediterraneus TaxID=83219 RepID=A0A061SKP1_9RHOB|nr:hypothetical protein PM02_19375 [Sulfitobacter mediterraneus]
MNQPAGSEVNQCVDNVLSNFDAHLSVFVDSYADDKQIDHDKYGSIFFNLQTILCIPHQHETLAKMSSNPL